MQGNCGAISHRVLQYTQGTMLQRKTVTQYHAACGWHLVKGQGGVAEVAEEETVECTGCAAMGSQESFKHLPPHSAGCAAPLVV